MRGLLAYLSDLIAGSGDSLLCIRMLSVVVDGRAVLLPRGALQRLLRLEPRLNRRGLTVVDGEFATVDLGSAVLVVDPPAVAADDAVLREFDERFLDRDRDAAAAQRGRYLISGMITDLHDDAATLSTALGYLLPLTANRAHVGPDRTLDTLVALFEASPELVALPHSDEDLLTAILNLAGG